MPAVTNARVGLARDAFTLVETLLAVAIAAVALSLAFSLYYTAARVVEKQQEHRQKATTIPRAMDRIAADLIRGFHAGDAEERIMRLETRDEGFGAQSSVIFCATGDDGEDWPWIKAYRIGYAVDGQPGGALVRTRAPLTGPGSEDPPQREILADPLTQFLLELHVEDSWTNAWANTAESVWPDAARITLHSPLYSEVHQLEVILPAGLTFRPSKTKQTE